MDGQVTPATTDEELLDLVAVSHVLTGPIAVSGAQPGDLLELEILGYTTAEFGWTAVLPGAGFVGDLVERPYVVRWEIGDRVARSADLPGVAVPASTHAGGVGGAPSRGVFEEGLRRGTPLAHARPPGRKPAAPTPLPA